jgi:hypothetical protein
MQDIAAMLQAAVRIAIIMMMLSQTKNLPQLEKSFSLLSSNPEKRCR